MDDSPYIYHLNSEEEYELVDQALLGRGESCSLVLDDERVSREHVEFCFENGVWSVVDLGGKNTTLVNKSEIPSHQKIPLGVGDLIQVGNQFFVFNSNEVPEHLQNSSDISNMKVKAYYEDVSASYKSFRSNPRKKMRKDLPTRERFAVSGNKDTLRRGAKALNKEIEKADKKIIRRDELKDKLKKSEKIFAKFEKKGLTIKDDSQLLELMNKKDEIESTLNKFLVELEDLQRQVKLYEEYKEARGSYDELKNKVQKLEDQDLTACREGLVNDRAQIQKKLQNYEKEEQQRKFKEEMTRKKREQEIKDKMEALQAELEQVKKAS